MAREEAGEVSGELDFRGAAVLLHRRARAIFTADSAASAMPATAGKVRRPAGNRQSTSSSLNTHSIWQNAIGYDPYAAAAPTKRLIVVANRLPVTPRRARDGGGWRFERSSGAMGARTVRSWRWGGDEGTGGTPRRA